MSRQNPQENYTHAYTREFVYTLMQGDDVVPQLKQYIAPQFADQLPTDSILAFSMHVSDGTNTTTKVYYGPEISYASTVGKPVPFNEKTQFNIGSMSKIIMLVMVLQSIQKQQLQLDDTIAQLINRYDEQQFNPAFLALKDKISDITIRQLLTHRSGLKDIRFRNYHQGDSLEDFIKFAFKPGTFFYANCNYICLAYLLQGIYNKLLPELLRELVTEPLKLENTAHIVTEPESNPAFLPGQELIDGIFQPQYTYILGGVSFTSTPSDLATIMLNIFHNPEFTQPQLVQEIKDSMTEVDFVVERDEGQTYSTIVEAGMTLERFYVQGLKAVLPKPESNYRTMYGMGAWTNGSAGFVLCDPDKPSVYVVTLTKVHVSKHAQSLSGRLNQLLWARPVRKKDPPTLSQIQLQNNGR